MLMNCIYLSVSEDYNKDKDIAVIPIELIHIMAEIIRANDAGQKQPNCEGEGK